MVFIETSIFTKLLKDYLSDEEYSGLQSHLAKQPDAGALIRGTDGVRKIRWRIKGRGKSSGIRVIYFWKVNEDEIWMLTLYGKSQKESIPSHILKKIAEEIQNV